MNIRMMGVGVLAVVCGLSAMFLVQALRKPATGPVIERVPVLYAAADIKPGETLIESMVEVREIPKDEAPEDALHKPADAIDRAAMTQLDRGDMLREKKLAEKGAGRGMAALIRTGMRAFTISTPSFSSSLAGFILPGNKVDVLLTVNLSGSNDDDPTGSSTTTLLQNIEILAVHTTVNTPTSNKTDPEQARSVTLLVTPEEAALLDLGQNKGTLHLSLRNLKDTGNSKSKPMTLADLQLPRSVAKPKPEVVVVEPPAPAEPLPPFDLPPQAETIEVKLAVRTLRGTQAGQDVLSLTRPAPPARKDDRQAKARPGPNVFPQAALGEPVRGSGKVGGGPPP